MFCDTGRMAMGRDVRLELALHTSVAPTPPVVPTARVAPSGLNATASISLPVPTGSVAASLRVLTFHNCVPLSPLPVPLLVATASVLPSGLNATEPTGVP